MPTQTTAAPRLPRSRAARKPTQLTPAERAAAGKSLRAMVPRACHAQLDLPADRPDPVGLLEGQAASRVPDLVPVRYGRMLASPFSYFRGAALPMASDLSLTPTTGLRVQVCGDAHLSNFGLFASPERRLVFSLNDFDETLPGPWEWDVKRMAASFEIAVREDGIPARKRRDIVLAGAAAYRQAMLGFAAMNTLDVWYAHFDVDAAEAQIEDQLGSAERKRIRKALARARTRNSSQALGKLAEMVDGRPRIISDPPLLVPVSEFYPAGISQEELVGRMRELMRSYARSITPSRRALLREFEFVDMARKVVGVGSVGTSCWVVLMQGRDAADPLVLQVKEAQRSVLCDYAGVSKINSEGERVVVGQRMMQAVSDIFLGWVRTAGFDGQRRDFYVRQFRDWKLSLDIATLRPRGLWLYSQLCGWTLARAHARSGDRIALAGYLGRSDVFEQAIADFAAAYADQNERDYAALAAAAASGRIRTVMDL
ncbi:MAG: DUF2252 domain-containing protein [Streptosporangiaceae bacterium]